MSLLLNGISPLSSGSLCFRQDRGTSMLSVRKQNKIRMFSTSSLSSTPYLLLKDSVKDSCLGEKVFSFSLLDPRKRETVVKIPDQSQSLSEDLKESWKIGSSRGWVATMNKHDFTLRLSNIFDPFSSCNLVSLPPLVNNLIEDEDKERYKDEEPVVNVSLSCPPEQDGCVVAVKFLGPYLSLCRLGRSEWTHIKTPLGFDCSKVMYSKRDRMFYLNFCSRVKYSAQLPCDLAESDFPPMRYYRTFPLRDVPAMTESERDQIGSYSKSGHLVESPSGELFTLLEFQQCLYEGKTVSWWDGLYEWKDLSFKTKRFMVFRQDSEKEAECYTEDIGDLCIFIGCSNEAFCVTASMYPGLNSNSIYFAWDSEVGVYDIASGTISDLAHSATSSSCFWIAPLER